MFQLASLTDVHWTMSGEVVLMTLFGGLGTVFGPVVGAFLIIAMENYLAPFGQWVLVIQGAIFVVCVLVFRRGIVGELAKRIARASFERNRGFQSTSQENIMSAEARLKELGIVLPPLPKPVANYVPYRLAGKFFTSPARAARERRQTLTGKLGADISLEEGYRRARLVGLGLLAAMRDALGSLDRVDYIVKLLGMVNAVPDFNNSPKVINGCSDLFVEVFGDAGRHARSAVGNVMLPNQISVEIEGIVAVKP